MSLRGIKLITFDATNTLLKFRVPPWEFYTRTARDHGYKGTEQVIKTRMLESYKFMWDKFPNFGKSNISWEEWWTQVVQYTFEGHLSKNTNVNEIANKLIMDFTTDKCWSVAPSSKRLLRTLRDRHKIIGVISNFDPRLNDILQNVNIIDNFDFVLNSYELGFSKPDERIFKHAIEQCKSSVKPSEALHIGDDVKKDYEGARAAGWHAILLSEKYKSETPPASKHVFKNLEQLSYAIEKNTLQL